MKYLVKVKTLEWHDVAYTIEANSEDKAKELVEKGGGDLEYDDYDCADHFEVISVEECYED